MAAEESFIVDIPDNPHKPSLQQRLDALPVGAVDSQKFTIFRVPTYIRESRQIYYEPRFLSIGPYHHGKPHLQAMEEHKMLYLRDFLLRSTIALESYLSVVKSQLSRVRSCYFETIFQFSDDEFAEILLLDGCFILEFLFKYMDGETIFGNVGWMLPLIRCDLLMLENQIPFFVLQSLFDHLLASKNNINDENNDGRSSPESNAGSASSSKNDMPSLVDIFVNYLMRGKEEGSDPVAHSEIYHLLHLYHCFYVSKPNLLVSGKKFQFLGLHKVLKFAAVATTLVTYFQKKNERSKRAPRTVPSATKLHDTGVKFKKKDTDNILDITFKNGILEIPFLSIEDTTKSRIMNLVAFEQCLPVKKRYLSSYVGFMDYIIDTAKDISILRQCGILENKLTSDEEAAAFFNQLSDCAYIDYEQHYLAGLFKEVNKYCSSNWHEWRAKLKRDYFSNPWAILSFGAAVVLLILTFLQTFFAMYAYFRPPKS